MPQRAVTSSETKRDRTSEIVAAGYRVYFSGVKGRKGQHGVGLAVKEEIVEKAGKDGIAIECISARLLKARISIKSTFVLSANLKSSTKKGKKLLKSVYYRIPPQVGIIHEARSS